jgi:uncharacterized membrane protein (UPF0136 family)
MSSRTALLWLGSIFGLFFWSTYLIEDGQNTFGSILLLVDILSLVGFSVARHLPAYMSRKNQGVRLSATRRRQAILLVILGSVYLVVGRTDLFQEHIDRLIILTGILAGAAIAIVVRCRDR